jgi:hypothetical protein
MTWPTRRGADSSASRFKPMFISGHWVAVGADALCAYSECIAAAGLSHPLLFQRDR